MATLPLRRVEVEWGTPNVLVNSDLRELQEHGAQMPGDRLPSGRLVRQIGKTVAVFSQGRPAPQPRFMVMATVLPSHNRDLGVAERQTRLVVGVERKVGNTATWYAGLVPAGETLGHMYHRGLLLTAAAVPTLGGEINRGFIGELTGDTYIRLATLGVSLRGQPGLAARVPLTEPQVADLSDDIVIIEPPVFVPNG